MIAALLLTGGCRPPARRAAAPPTPAPRQAFADPVRYLSLHPAAPLLERLDREIARLERLAAAPPPAPLPSLREPPPVSLPTPEPPAEPPPPPRSVDLDRVRAALREEFEIRRAALPDRAEEAYAEEVERIRHTFLELPFARAEPAERDPLLERDAELQRRRRALESRLRELEPRPDDPIRFGSSELARRREEYLRLREQLDALLGPVVGIVETPTLRELQAERERLESRIRELLAELSEPKKLTRRQQRARREELETLQDRLAALRDRLDEAREAAPAVRREPIAQLQQAIAEARRSPEPPPEMLQRLEEAARRREARRREALEQLERAEQAELQRAAALVLPDPLPAPPTPGEKPDPHEPQRLALVQAVRDAPPPPEPPDRRAAYRRAALALRRLREELYRMMLQDIRTALAAAASERSLRLALRPGAAPDRTAELMPAVRALLAHPDGKEPTR